MSDFSLSCCQQTDKQVKHNILTTLWVINKLIDASVYAELPFICSVSASVWCFFTLVFIEYPLASLWGCVLHQWGVLSSFPILLSVASLFEIPVSTHSLFLWAFRSLESQLRQSKHNGHTVGPYQAAADRDPPCFSIVTTTCLFHMGPFSASLSPLSYCTAQWCYIQFWVLRDGSGLPPR